MLYQLAGNIKSRSLGERSLLNRLQGLIKFTELTSLGAVFKLSPRTVLLKYLTSQIDSKSLNVLVIEDDEDLAFLLRYILQKNGYVVTEARSKREGQKKLAETRFDFMILDQYLPDGSGLDLLAEPKQCLNYKTPVFLSSGNITEDLRSHPKIQAVFQKPYNYDDLLRVMREYA